MAYDADFNAWRAEAEVRRVAALCVALRPGHACGLITTRSAAREGRAQAAPPGRCRGTAGSHRVALHGAPAGTPAPRPTPAQEPSIDDSWYAGLDLSREREHARLSNADDVEYWSSADASKRRSPLALLRSLAAPKPPAGPVSGSSDSSGELPAGRKRSSRSSVAPEPLDERPCSPSARPDSRGGSAGGGFDRTSHSASSGGGRSSPPACAGPAVGGWVAAPVTPQPLSSFAFRTSSTDTAALETCASPRLREPPGAAGARDSPRPRLSGWDAHGPQLGSPQRLSGSPSGVGSARRASAGGGRPPAGRLVVAPAKGSQPQTQTQLRASDMLDSVSVLSISDGEA
jgi:hypothetical protein